MTSPWNIQKKTINHHFCLYSLVIKHGNGKEHGKSPMNWGFNRKIMDKLSIFPCHVWLPEGKSPWFHHPGSLRAGLNGCDAVHDHATQPISDAQQRSEIDVFLGFTLWLCQNSFGKWPFIVSFPISSMVIFHILMWVSTRRYIQSYPTICVYIYKYTYIHYISSLHSLYDYYISTLKPVLNPLKNHRFPFPYGFPIVNCPWWLAVTRLGPSFCSVRARRRELMVVVICVMKLEKMPMAKTTTPCWKGQGHWVEVVCGRYISIYIYK